MHNALKSFAGIILLVSLFFAPVGAKAQQDTDTFAPYGVQCQTSDEKLRVYEYRNGGVLIMCDEEKKTLYMMLTKTINGEAEPFYMVKIDFVNERVYPLLGDGSNDSFSKAIIIMRIIIEEGQTFEIDKEEGFDLRNFI